MANGNGSGYGDAAAAAAGLGPGGPGDYGGPGYGWAGWGGYAYGYGNPGSQYGGPGYTGDIGGYGYNFGPVGMFGPTSGPGWTTMGPTSYPTEINTVPQVNPLTQKVEYTPPQDIPARQIGVPMPAPNPLDPWDRGISPIFDVRSPTSMFDPRDPGRLDNPPAFLDMPAAAFNPGFATEAPGWIGMNPMGAWTNAGSMGTSDPDPSSITGPFADPQGQMGAPGPNSPMSQTNVLNPQYWEPPPGADFNTQFTNPTLENPYYHLFGGGTNQGYQGPLFSSQGQGQFDVYSPGYGGQGPGYGPMTTGPEGELAPAYAERQTFAYSKPVWFDPNTGGYTYTDTGAPPAFWERP